MENGEGGRTESLGKSGYSHTATACYSQSVLYCQHSNMPLVPTAMGTVSVYTSPNFPSTGQGHFQDGKGVTRTCVESTSSVAVLLHSHIALSGQRQYPQCSSAHAEGLLHSPCLLTPV